MKHIIGLVLAMVSFNAFAVDMDDCRDAMDRVHRAGRNASMSIESQEDLDEVSSVLDEIQSKIDKARRSCEANTMKKYCIHLRGMVMRGQRTDAKNLCATNFEPYYPGFCGVCIGQ